MPAGDVTCPSRMSARGVPRPVPVLGIAVAVAVIVPAPRMAVLIVACGPVFIATTAVPAVAPVAAVAVIARVVIPLAGGRRRHDRHGDPGQELSTARSTGITAGAAATIPKIINRCNCMSSLRAGPVSSLGTDAEERGDWPWAVVDAPPDRGYPMTVASPKSR